MKRTRALIVAPRKLEFVEESLPALGPKDVLLKVIAVGACHSDLPIYQGLVGAHLSKHGFLRLEAPATYPRGSGHEPVCQVADIGSEVSRYRVGDYVAGSISGAYATHLIMPESLPSMFKLPQTPGRPIKNFCLEPAAAIVNIVREASCKFGDRIAVVGCGFMGLMTLAGLRKSGARTVAAIDLLDSKLELAKKYGASHCLNPRDCRIDDAAYEITDGGFFDVVVEISGSIKGLDTACAIIKSPHDPAGGFNGAFRGRGRILIPSVYGGEEIFPARLGLNLMLRTPELLSTHPAYSPRPGEDMLTAIDAYVDGDIPVDEVITHEFRFGNLTDAFAALEQPPADYIKGLVVFD